MASQPASLMKAYLDYVCTTLREKTKPISFHQFCLAVSVSAGVILGCGGSTDNAVQVSGEQVCNDQQDNDSDGFTDCKDQDCFDDSGCDSDAGGTGGTVYSAPTGGWGGDGGSGGVEEGGLGGSIGGQGGVYAGPGGWGGNVGGAAGMGGAYAAPGGWGGWGGMGGSAGGVGGAYGVPTEYICDDDIDNDNDGRMDCDDWDCEYDYNCGGYGGEYMAPGGYGGEETGGMGYGGSLYAAPPEYTCDDNLDNDADGSIDCDDPDCEGDYNCGGYGGMYGTPGGYGGDGGDGYAGSDPGGSGGSGSEDRCDDNVDNDKDGDTDCNDEDCYWSNECGSGGAYKAP